MYVTPGRCTFTQQTAYASLATFDFIIAAKASEGPLAARAR